MLVADSVTCLPVNMSPLCQDASSISFIILLLVFSFFCGALFTRHLAGEGRGTLKCFLLFLPFLFMIMLLHVNGASMATLKGFILFLILFQASVSDIKTRQASDVLSVMILITALIGTPQEALPSMLFALLLVGLPQFLVASFKPGTYGGADIKITAASAFLLGIWKGLFALIVGLLAAIIIPYIVRHIKNQSTKEGIPMIPYFSFGILLAFIL